MRGWALELLPRFLDKTKRREWPPGASPLGLSLNVGTSPHFPMSTPLTGLLQIRCMSMHMDSTYSVSILRSAKGFYTYSMIHEIT